MLPLLLAGWRSVLVPASDAPGCLFNRLKCRTGSVFMFISKYVCLWWSRDITALCKYGLKWSDLIGCIYINWDQTIFWQIRSKTGSTIMTAKPFWLCMIYRADECWCDLLSFGLDGGSQEDILQFELKKLYCSTELSNWFQVFVPTN